MHTVAIAAMFAAGFVIVLVRLVHIARIYLTDAPSSARDVAVEVVWMLAAAALIVGAVMWTPR